MKICTPPLDFYLFGDEATQHNGVLSGQGFISPNSAMYFDGTDDYADLGNTVNFKLLYTKF